MTLAVVLFAPCFWSWPLVSVAETMKRFEVGHHLIMLCIVQFGVYKVNALAHGSLAGGSFARAGRCSAVHPDVLHAWCISALQTKFQRSNLHSMRWMLQILSTLQLCSQHLSMTRR